MGAKSLSGTDKAAIVLLALGEELAAGVMAGMSPAEAKRVAMALTRLGRVDTTLANEVLAEFQAMIARGPRSGLDGSTGAARRLLTAAAQARGEDVSTLVIADESSTLRETLVGADSKALARHLRNEHPQTIALVLAHLHPKAAGETLKLLPVAIHVEAMTRLAKLDTVAPEALRDLEEALRQALTKDQQQSARSVGGVDQVAQLVAGMERAAAQSFLEQLEERDPELAEAVRAKMFRFADLVKVEDAGLRVLLAKAPRKTLLLALKSAPDAIVVAIKRNVSTRAAQALDEDVAALGKQRLADVEAAQRELADLALQLESQGALRIRQDDETYV